MLHSGRTLGKIKGNQFFISMKYVNNRKIEIEYTSNSHITSWQSQSLRNRTHCIVHCALYNVCGVSEWVVKGGLLCSLYCLMYTLHCALWEGADVLCELHRFVCTIHCVHYMLCIDLCALHNVHTLHCALWVSGERGAASHREDFAPPPLQKPSKAEQCNKCNNAQCCSI